MTARVLIVDDEPHISQIASRYLIKAGYEVETAVNGEDALKKIAGALPDALITDIKMPRMDGKILCETIAADYPDWTGLRIVMTSQTEFELRAWVAQLSNVELMEKPISPRRLVERLNTFFDSEKPS